MTQAKPRISRGERNVRWIERFLYFPDGPLVGHSVRLADFQKDIIKQIYDNEVPTSKAIISMGRKNAKTALTSWLLLLHLAGPEARVNSQLVSAARTKDQAGILFDYARKTVLFSEPLRALIKMRVRARELEHTELGTTYKSLSSEGSSLYGLNPSFIVHDELGQVKGPRDEVFTAIETATNAQKAPLTIIISTQAGDDNALLSRQIDDAQAGADPSTVLILYTAPKDADPYSEEAIRAANPAYDIWMNKANIAKKAGEAQRMPTEERDWRLYTLNQRIHDHATFVEREVWAENNEQPAPWEGKKLYCGLDLSGSRDLTAFVMMYQDEEDSRWNMYPMFWLPEDEVESKTRTDKFDYDVKVSKSQILTTPGKSIKYDWVAGQLKDISEKAEIIKIGFDQWAINHFKESMLRVGFDQDFLEDRMEKFGQGFRDMTPAIRLFEEMLLEGQIKHGDHPVLGWNMENAVVTVDASGNRKFDKAKSTGRIDGVVAATMACAMIAVPEEQTGSYLETEDLIII